MTAFPMTALPITAVQRSTEMLAAERGQRARLGDMIAHGDNRPWTDPQWLEIAARQEESLATAGAMAVVGLLAILLAILYAAIS